MPVYTEKSLQGGREAAKGAASEEHNERRREAPLGFDSSACGTTCRKSLFNKRKGGGSLRAL